MRPGYQRVRCVVCGVPREKAPRGFISTRGKCARCGLQAQLDNVDGIEAREGVPYQRWRLGIVSRLLPPEVVGVMFRSGVFAEDAGQLLDEAGRGV